MSFTSVIRAVTCAAGGHIWNFYFYPHGDGWFGAAHYRRECLRCDKDEAVIC